MKRKSHTGKLELALREETAKRVNTWRVLGKEETCVFTELTSRANKPS